MLLNAKTHLKHDGASTADICMVKIENYNC